MAQLSTLDGIVTMKRTPLFFVVLAAVLVWAGCVSERGVSATREGVLAATPIGSDATNVLKYVVDDLKPQWAASYYTYVDALEASRHVRLNVQPGNPGPPAVPKPLDWPPQENWPPRTIDVVIKTYLNGDTLDATWTFDKNDKLLKVDVDRIMKQPALF